MLVSPHTIRKTPNPGRLPALAPVGLGVLRIVCGDTSINQCNNKGQKDSSLDPQSSPQCLLADDEMSNCRGDKVNKRCSETNNSEHDEESESLLSVARISLAEGSVSDRQSRCD